MGAPPLCSGTHSGDVLNCRCFRGACFIIQPFLHLFRHLLLRLKALFFLKHRNSVFRSCNRREAFDRFYKCCDEVSVLIKLCVCAVLQILHLLDLPDCGDGTGRHLFDTSVARGTVREKVLHT